MDDLDLIKDKLNIVDLIQEYLPLKKAGVNFKAPCPFHQEKTPSFMVSPERGIWHCFGCQKGGDHFKFLMEKEGIEFTEALEILAKKAGVTLKKQAGAQKDKKTRLLEVNLKAAQFYHYLLTKHQLGQKALEYLKNRGLEDGTIEEFNLGYAPNSWDSLRNFLIKRGFSDGELIEVGLTVSSKSGSYDRFRGRVIFPLVDLKSQVIGFAGRILDQGEPKYINTPVTPLFDKSHFLFGLNLSKGVIRTQNKAILTEGEMDMILSFQGGIKNVVACKGTALTSGQIDLIKRHAETILLCFDKDLAGDSASRRGIEMADQAGLNIKVIEIPQGKDPAELVLKDPQMWQEAVETAKDIYEYYLRSVSLRFDPKTAEGKKKIAGEILPLFAKISNPVTLEHYIQKLSALISVPEDLLRKEVKKSTIFSSSYSSVLRLSPPEGKTDHKSRQELLEEYLMVLLFHIPKNLIFVPNFPETLFLSESYRSLYVLLVLYLDAISFKTKFFEIADFIKGVPQEMVALIDRLYLTDIEDKLNNSKVWQEEIATVISELKKALVKASLEKLSDEIKSAQSFGRIEQLEVLNKRFRDLSLKLKTL